VARPRRLVVITGTGTEVGKSWVTSALATELQAGGLRVSARKPVQSFAPGEPTDADLLARVTGDTARLVCPPGRWYEVAMAPPMAAEALGRPSFTIADLVAELTWPSRVQVGLVEGAGGVRSPLATDGDLVDLAQALQPDHVVLIADARLGTLNLVRLCVDALDGLPVVVYLNRYEATDDLQRRNRLWIEQRLVEALVTTPAELCAFVTEGRT
jgi:dethiobiotin synthetase